MPCPALTMHIFTRNPISFFQMQFWMVMLAAWGTGHGTRGTGHGFIRFRTLIQNNSSYKIILNCAYSKEYANIYSSTLFFYRSIPSAHLPSLYTDSLETSCRLGSAILPLDGCSCGIFMEACACPCPCPCIVGDIPFTSSNLNSTVNFASQNENHKQLTMQTPTHTEWAFVMRCA